MGSGTGMGSESGEGWTVRVGETGKRVPADPGAVREVLGTLELLAAIRRDEGEIGAPALTIVVEVAGGKEIRVLLAREGAGPTDRVWAARADRGGRFLIDGYAARALDVDADDLRERRPYRGRTFGATRIELGEASDQTVLAGPPWRVELPGGPARADAGAVQGLLEQLERLRVERFEDGAGRAARRLLAVQARAGRSELVERGDCSGGALIDTPAGAACARVPAALTDAARDPQRLIDRRLVGASIDGVARLRLERGGRAVEVDREAAPDALRAWLARWRDAAAGPVVPAGGLPPQLATVVLELDGGARERVSVSRTGDGLAARREGEPVALVLHPWADTHLDPEPYRFRSLDLLSDEPSALRAATARRSGRTIESIERGETLEEWRDAAGAAAPLAAVDALREAAGFLRAESTAAARARPLHGLSPPRRTVELVFDPPPGESRPLQHTLDIGARSASGCYARLDRDPVVFELSARRCAAFLGPWTAR